MVTWLVLLVGLLVLNCVIGASCYLMLQVGFFHSTAQQATEASRQPEMPAGLG